MKHRDASPLRQSPNIRAAHGAIAMLAVLVLSACGGGDKSAAQPAGQSLARVNGQEITIHQINEELMRSNVAAPQQEAARKQLLESLIDRQLLQGEALRDKIDRDPQIMAAIERGKAQTIAQAWLQRRVASAAKPTDAEIDDYFKQHPELFSERKLFEMDQLVVQGGAHDADFKARVEAARSLDEVAAWLDAKSIQFGRTQSARTGADLPLELVKKLQGMRQGQMFMVREGERQLVVALTRIRPATVSVEQARPLIAQYLANRRAKEAADAELVRLRAAAKIEYLNQAVAATDANARPSLTSPVATPATAGVATAGVATGMGAVAVKGSAAPAADIERGVLGLK